MHLVCRCSLPVWRRSFLKKGTPVTYFVPTLDPPLDGSDRKTTTLVRDHEYFIRTKFHQNPSNGFGEEVENVKGLRTDDGRCVMTIAHSSLRLRWAKKQQFEKVSWYASFQILRYSKKSTRSIVSHIIRRPLTGSHERQVFISSIIFVDNWYCLCESSW